MGDCRWFLSNFCVNRDDKLIYEQRCRADDVIDDTQKSDSEKGGSWSLDPREDINHFRRDRDVRGSNLCLDKLGDCLK